MTNPVYIVDAVRTPVGKAPRGKLSRVRPDDLLVHALKGLMQRQPSVPLDAIEDVIIGCAMPEGDQGMNVARIAALLADFPDTVPGMTINRFCSSGVQSIALAANRVALGDADVIVAGGTESMSLVPMGGFHFTANPNYFSNNEHLSIAYGMGITAEKVAAQWDVTREQQEAFALESHRRASAAIKSNAFADEIIPFEVNLETPDLKKQTIKQTKFTLQHDEGPRADTTLEKMATLRTVFDAKGGVTAATSSQMSDGAGAVLVVSEKALKQYQLTPLAKFISYAVAGVPPGIMGIGPVKAIPKALAKASLTLKDIDWIELNEAFAAQTLAVMKELSLDHAKTNPLGGAIALGHPLGATGAIRTATLLHGMRRQSLKYGMVTMCIGTGMGAAAIFEAV